MAAQSVACVEVAKGCRHTAVVPSSHYQSSAPPAAGSCPRGSGPSPPPSASAGCSAQTRTAPAPTRCPGAARRGATPPGPRRLGCPGSAPGPAGRRCGWMWMPWRGRWAERSWEGPGFRGAGSGRPACCLRVSHGWRRGDGVGIEDVDFLGGFAVVILGRVEAVDVGRFFVSSCFGELEKCPATSSSTCYGNHSHGTGT